jgi:hypothetical protein
MSTLLEKMLSTGSTKSSAVLSSSPFFNAKEAIPTDLPILNIAFSGSIDGGLLPGLTVVAGVSKSFKTLLSLYCMKAYLDKYPEGIALLYDSEFGITPEYIESIDIDIDRVVHIPVKDVEELKFDMVQKLDAIGKKDKVFIMIDSVGNLASKKELEDAQNEKSVADMSRAKSLKSLFRIITPYLTTKGIPCLAVNHVYLEQCLAGDTLVKTNRGSINIKDINVGDMVYTQNGMQKVLDTLGPERLDSEDKEFFELQFDDGSTVRCTNDHKFLDVFGNWVEAGSMNMGTKFR